MRKKIVILITSILGFFLLLNFPDVTEAACRPTVGGVCSATSGSMCIVGNYFTGSRACCDTPQDCTNLQNNTSQPTGGLSGNSPTGGCGSDSINTAIGCVPVLGGDHGTAFSNFILRWAVGVGGGIAFLLILLGGFMIMTSAANPDRLKAGQELLTSAIYGLILIIFSVFILKFIGIDILGLGAFGFGS